jgi:hypothetical protein
LNPGGPSFNITPLGIEIIYYNSLIVLFITNEFGKALDEGKEIRVEFCDISKAFDRVWHIGLLKKMESIGIHGPLLSWIQNYLSNRFASK